MNLHTERGLSLTEVMVVIVLATLVMLGMVSFYVSSQGTWMDASAQAITQREATTLLESITAKAHLAASALPINGGKQLQLNNWDGTTYHFWWNVGGQASDSLIHEGPDIFNDRGATATSTCEMFQCVTSTEMVDIRIRLRSAQGDHVDAATRVALLNRP